MKNIYLLILLFFAPIVALGYGLGFYDSEQPINERTSYSVFGDNKIEYKEFFGLSFDVTLSQPVEIGYICRIKTVARNDSVIYNLFFDKRGDDFLFRFNQEGKAVLMSLPCNRRQLLCNHWFGVSIRFDLKSHAIRMKIGDNEASVHVPSLPGSIQPSVTFGRSDYQIDVPTMAVNNVRIEGSTPFVFALDECEGTEVHDTAGRVVGHVENPVWLINSAYHWKQEVALPQMRGAGYAYDMQMHSFKFFNADTLVTFTPATHRTEVRRLAQRCPVSLFLAGAFVHPDDGRLYAYEVYAKDDHTAPMMASLDPVTLAWRTEIVPPLRMQLHHHDFTYNSRTGNYVLFGGFGNQFFSNTFYRYMPGAPAWDTVSAPSGPHISPRYFTATGLSPDNKHLYIFGGMGNESGEQIVGRKYFYDLYRVDIDCNRVEKLWELHGEVPHTVPARGLAVVDDSTFFVLRYPESKSASYLKLYKFSIKDGSYEVLGDSIPIQSDKIITNARLYHDRSEGKFYVAVQESSDDASSRLTVYSLTYPPLSATRYAEIDTSDNTKTSRWWTVAIAMSIVVVGAIIYLVWRYRRASRARAMVVETVVSEPVAPERQRRPDSMYLFGEFEAIDSRGRNVSHLFTSRLHAIMCLILQYSDGEGIRSSVLGSMIWPDKPKDKVKNSRGVALNNLRKILADFQGISLVHDNSCFRFESAEPFYCDYLRCMELAADEALQTQHRGEFIEILSRGKFLQGFDDPIFDDIKHSLETTLETAILKQVKMTFAAAQHRECLNLVAAALNIDPTNDSALAYGVRSAIAIGQEKEARRMYRRYEEEYLRTNGSTLPHTYEDFVNKN